MRKTLDIKKLVLLNLPYVFAFYFVDKLATVFRLAPGTEFIDKLTGGFANFGAAFANPLPSFHPVDLLIGVAGGALLKLAVYIKGKNRKKFRKEKNTGQRVGADRKTSGLTWMMTSQQCHPHPDRGADHEQPSEATEVREE